MSKLVVLALFGMGCAPVVHTFPSTIPERRWVETSEMPPDAELEDVSWAEGYETQVGPYEPGESTNPMWSGLVVSEARAARDALVRIRYRELRARYEQDRRIWVIHREAYETRLRLSAERMAEMRPDWWDRNGGYFVGVGGFVLGVAATVGILSVVDVAVE